MYKVDIKNKKLEKIPETTFSDWNLKERFDIQEWIEKTPEILGEDLLIISKELTLESGKRLDLLAIDRKANLVIIELKRDNSGSGVDWQAIKYASYCSNFSNVQIYQFYADYNKINVELAQSKIEEFVDYGTDDLNNNQRIILVSKTFRSEVVSAVLWLRDSQIDISCIRLTPHIDKNNLYINPEIMIPLPEAKDYIQKKERKSREKRIGNMSNISLEKSDLNIDDLSKKIIESLSRDSDLTPRIIIFLKIVSSENRVFIRQEIRQKLFDNGIGNNLGQAGRYLSNISQFLTNKSNSHLRQIIDFGEISKEGQQKDQYKIIDEYFDFVSNLLDTF